MLDTNQTKKNVTPNANTKEIGSLCILHGQIKVSLYNILEPNWTKTIALNIITLYSTVYCSSTFTKI